MNQTPSALVMKQAKKLLKEFRANPSQVLHQKLKTFLNDNNLITVHMSISRIEKLFTLYDRMKNWNLKILFECCKMNEEELFSKDELRLLLTPIQLSLVTNYTEKWRAYKTFEETALAENFGEEIPKPHILNEGTFSGNMATAQ